MQTRREAGRAGYWTAALLRRDNTGCFAAVSPASVRQGSPALSIDLLARVFLPASLALIMFGLGVGLTGADFRRLLDIPRVVLIGLFGQFVLLPALALGLALAFGLAPALAAGLVILALCPGGVTSNFFSFLARGDVALSVTLTAVISLVAPFTVPLLAGWLVPLVSGRSADFQLGLAETWATLLALTLVPVGLGMLVRRINRFVAAELERWTGPVGIALMFLVIGGIVAENWDRMPEFFAGVGLVTVTLVTLALLAGWLIARAGGASKGQQATVAIEVGIQNGTMALLVTGVLMGSSEMSVVPAIYGLVMFPAGALFVLLARSTLTRVPPGLVSPAPVSPPTGKD